MSEGRMPPQEWEAELDCSHRDSHGNRCWACRDCRIYRHHESTVIDLNIKRFRLGDELGRWMREYILA